MSNKSFCSIFKEYKKASPKEILQDSQLKIDDCSSESDDENTNVHHPWSTSRQKPLPVAIKRKSETQISAKNKISNEVIDSSAIEIDWSDSNSSSDSNGSQIEWSNSQFIETQTTTSQKFTPPTELDMFLALIERECNSSVKAPPPKPPAKTTKKRSRKIGYLQQLQRTLESANANRKFLEHDKKFGLQCGREFRIVRLENAFGVPLATLEALASSAEEDHKEMNGSVCVVLDATIAQRVKVGSKLEAFFDHNVAPYICGEVAFFVQPHKLLLKS